VSGAVAAEAALAAPPTTLDELHKAVQRRIAAATGRQHGTDYQPLAVRLANAKRGAPDISLAALDADLQELLAASDDVLRRMVQHEATSARCVNPATERMLAAYRTTTMQQQNAALTRPRVTPAELVQQFAARGVTVAAGVDGNLHVTPADMLTPADREVLTACKPGILAALAAPATVI